MYEKFTDGAKMIMQLANHHAHRLNHEYIGTEHVLLGLLEEGSPNALDILRAFRLDPATVRERTEKLVPPGPEMVSAKKLPQTPRVKRAIEYAMEEACILRHDYVGTEHILLGFIREQQGVAAQVLANLGMSNLQDVRNAIVDRK